MQHANWTLVSKKTSGLAGGANLGTHYAGNATGILFRNLR